MTPHTDDVCAYQLHVSLEDADPAIWRRFLTPADIPVATMHHLLQIVMGWTHSHL